VFERAMAIKLASAVMVTLLLIGLLGCGGTYRAPKVQTRPFEETDKVIYKDRSLISSVGVLDISQDYVNGMLRARCRVRNLTGKTINAEIKIKFRDAQGFELADTPWTPMPLESGEIESFEQIASNPDAVDFRIVIQLAGQR
jgi:uncharacterized protein YcfL